MKFLLIRIGIAKKPLLENGRLRAKSQSRYNGGARPAKSRRKTMDV